MGFTSRKGAFREGSLDQYLKEISQYPLIDKAEERVSSEGRKRRSTSWSARTSGLSCLSPKSIRTKGSRSSI